jgi:hypothetical protein
VKQFNLPFSFPASANKIEYGQRLVFLGSCFSDEMGAKAKYFGLDTFTNPFGTVFHPLAIARTLLDTIQPPADFQERLVNREDLFFSWDAGGTVFGYSAVELNKKLESNRAQLKKNLENGGFLFITFGTAWGYREKQTNELVSNCHKFPGDSFIKELSSIEEIVFQWENVINLLKELNTNLKIVFTISPVRHSKDGLVENNQSKAILIEAVRRLVNENYASYFPSYEIVIDELRDYRFFKEDRVHPNDEAIADVWDRFSDSYFNEDTKRIMEEVRSYRLADDHRSLFSESKEHQKHLLNTQFKREELLVKYPHLKL